MKKGKKNILKNKAFLLILMLLLPGLLLGCKSRDGNIEDTLQPAADSIDGAYTPENEDTSANEDTSESDYNKDSAHYTGTEEAEETGGSEKTEESEEAPALPEDGSYYEKDDVSLYLHLYKKLPGNYITKKEAKALGWEGGSVENVAPGKAIGGDYFGNYEGLLPEDDDYFECDIDTLGKKSRGAKRIIYSSDYENIYYTEDHYESFSKVEFDEF